MPQCQKVMVPSASFIETGSPKKQERPVRSLPMNMESAP